MKFTKMHGAGNDYVYVDCFNQPVPQQLEQLAQAISHRRFGVGGDGLILIRPSDVADARMQMLNADGSESEMCGNGIRCVAKFVHDHGIAKKESLSIETGAGVLDLRLQVDTNGLVQQVTVDMGPPELNGPKVPTTITPLDDHGRVVAVPVEFGGRTLEVTCVSMGNPHCIVFVEKATDELVLGLGPKIETDPRFPNRINVEFVEVISPTEVNQRTWERGSGETWACGTGASAVCVAGVLTGRTERTILNHLLGGDLTLHWDPESEHVMMTGPASEVFSGEFQWPPQAATADVAAEAANS
jgi:diaminopimelate epimerase